MFIVPICTVSVNFRCKPFPYNAESLSLLYYITKKNAFNPLQFGLFCGSTLQIDSKRVYEKAVLLAPI